MSIQRLGLMAIAVVWCISQASPLTAKKPVQKAKNTIKLQPTEAIEPVRFSPPLKFHVEEVIDRTGNSPPNLVLERGDGFFLSEEPKEIVRLRVVDSLKRANSLASDASSADYLLTIYLLQFGQAEGIGSQIFLKVAFNVLVKNSRTGESEQVSAWGTASTGKKKRIPMIVENALVGALRVFLRSTSFREAVNKLEQSAKLREAALAVEAAKKEAAEAPARAKETAARESSAEAPRPPEEPGTLVVSSTLPGAEVYVDDGFVGNTPAKVRLHPGKYTVRVTMAGQEDWMRELSVLAGSELKISVTHTPKIPPREPSETSSDSKALSKDDILGLLTNYVPNARIAALVRERGIKFTATATDLDEIAEAGGDSGLLETLRQTAARREP